MEKWFEHIRQKQTPHAWLKAIAQDAESLDAESGQSESD